MIKKERIMTIVILRQAMKMREEDMENIIIKTNDITDLMESMLQIIKIKLNTK